MNKLFSYRAREQNGKLVEGSIFAESERQVAAYLHEKSYHVHGITEKKQRIKSFFDLYTLGRSRETAVFFRQLAFMLQAGLPLAKAVEILAQQGRQKLWREIFSAVAYDLAEGKSLSEALVLRDRFSPLILAMVSAGEQGGILDTVLADLATYLEKTYEFRSKISAAMLYPICIMLVGTVMMLVMTVVVLPQFARLFAQLQMPLPWLTSKILVLATFFQESIWLLGMGLAVGIGVLFKVYNMPQYRLSFDRLLLAIPFVGVMIKKSAAARFMRTLSALLRGGLPILSALPTANKVMENIILQEAIARAERYLADGGNLADALRRESVFDAIAVWMVAVGEETGALESMLHKIAEYYEADVEMSTNRCNALLEPVVILFLGVVVGTMVVAVMLPALDSMVYVVG